MSNFDGGKGWSLLVIFCCYDFFVVNEYLGSGLFLRTSLEYLTGVLWPNFSKSSEGY